MVNELCGLELNQGREEEKMAFGAKESAKVVQLPPAEGFVSLFKDYMEEVKGAKGSKRSKSEPRMPLDIGKLPPRNRQNLKAIEIQGQPWLQSACVQNTSLTSAQVFNFNVVPKVLLEQDRIRQWESSAREEFSLASYNTWFLKAARTTIEWMQQKLMDCSKMEEMRAEDWSGMYSDMDKVLELVDSADIRNK